MRPPALDVYKRQLVGSPLHVKRLLMNVLSNAIKYNRDKGRVMLDCFELSSTGAVSYTHLDVYKRQTLR